MKLIIGLGNPGKKYEKTRHNLGFMVIDELIQSSNLKARNYNLKLKTNSKFKAEILETEFNNKKIVMAKPLTYMNNSGLAVSSISNFYKIESSSIWVIHDDLDFPLGAIKIKFGGASAGHNGIESIIQNLGTDNFWRFRLGIGLEDQKKGKTEDYVLEEFRPEERELVQEIIKRGTEATKTALEEGMETAMNKYNS